jgi:hypothetical protein
VIIETIAKAKAGEMSPEDALFIISPTELICPEEWEVLNAAVKKHGHMIGDFLYGNPEKN